MAEGQELVSRKPNAVEQIIIFVKTFLGGQRVDKTTPTNTITDAYTPPEEKIDTKGTNVDQQV